MSSILNQFRWAQNPWSQLPGAVASGQQRALLRRQLEMQERHSQRADDRERQSIEAATNMRTYKLMDSAMGKVQELYQSDFPEPKKLEIANKILQQHTAVAQQNPEFFNQEILQQASASQLAPLGSPPSETTFTAEQIPQLRQGLQTAMQGLSAAVSPEQEQKRAMEAEKLRKADIDAISASTGLKSKTIKALDDQREFEDGSVTRALTALRQGDMNSVGTEVIGLAQAGILGKEEALARLQQLQEAAKTPEGAQQLEQMLVQRKNQLSNHDDFSQRHALAAQWMQDQGVAGTEVAENLGAFNSMRQDVKEGAFAFADEQIQLQQSQRIQERSAGAPRINVGRAEAPTSTKVKTAEQLRHARETKTFIQDIKRLGDPGQYLGYMNRAEFWLSDQERKTQGIPVLEQVLETLSPMEKKQYQKASEFRALVSKYKSVEFKNLIGAAQTKTEISNLVDAILNTKMSDVQFRSAMKILERHTNRVIEASTDLLERGIDLGTPEYEDAMRDQVGLLLDFEANQIRQALESQTITPGQARSRLSNLENLIGQ
jgi:hypothetical protein